jgi:hypothetical protein
MHQALGASWEQLPKALQSHYQHDKNADIGELDVVYPAFMQPYLTFLHLFGALINKGGKKLPTVVEKHMDENIQYWKRTVNFPDDDIVYFNSFWVHDKSNDLIEFINPYIGLRMAVTVENNVLHYEGRHFVVKSGGLLIPIPEWLLLGHTTIVERALSDTEFEMDFRMTHPLFGEVFRYSGKFRST